MKVLTVTGYKPFELGIFNEKHQGITYIKKRSIKITGISRRWIRMGID